MGYVERHLLPGERIVYRTRLHWVIFAKPAMLALVGIAIGGVLWYVAAEPTWLWMIGGGVAFLGLLGCLVRFVEMMTSEFAVTTTRLVLKIGLISRHTTEILLTKVEAIAIDQGLLARLLNFGDLTVTGTGGAREVFPGVRDPVGLRNHVQQASLAAQPDGRAAPPPGLR